MQKPDFFIVGAPKCGTTSLKRYLDAHPEIYIPKKPTEPHFFDFVEDTLLAYSRVLKFLDVDDAFEPDFNVYNPNTKPRSKRAMYLRYNYPQWVKKLGRVALPSQNLRNAVMAGLTGLNTRQEKRPPMDPEVRADLQREFRPEVETLSELLDRDLMHWVND